MVGIGKAGVLLLLVAFGMKLDPTQASLADKVVIAINAGGPAHRDVYGVPYSADKNTEGIASDYGKRFDIERVPQEDAVLYQTERYSTGDKISYEVPLKNDGDYVLVLKFAEVYFQAPNQKVFHVFINNIGLIKNIDIYAQVGHATAFDLTIPFAVTNKGKSLILGDEAFPLTGSKFTLSFHRGPVDNPKINAFYVLRGTIQDVPQLPPLEQDQGHQGIHEGQEEEEDNLFEEDFDEDVYIPPGTTGSQNIKPYSRSSGSREVRSGPTAFDPWLVRSSMEQYLPLYLTLPAGLLGFGMVWKPMVFTPISIGLISLFTKVMLL